MPPACSLFYISNRNLLYTRPHHPAFCNLHCRKTIITMTTLMSVQVCTLLLLLIPARRHIPCPPLSRHAPWESNNSYLGCGLLISALRSIQSHPWSWQELNTLDLSTTLLQFDSGQTPERADRQPHLLYVKRTTAGLCARPPSCSHCAAIKETPMWSTRTTPLNQQSCGVVHSQQSTAQRQQNHGADCWF